MVEEKLPPVYTHTVILGRKLFDGKPYVVCGPLTHDELTRLVVEGGNEELIRSSAPTVEFILAMLAQERPFRESFDRLREYHPQLTMRHVRACLAYAHHTLYRIADHVRSVAAIVNVLAEEGYHAVREDPTVEPEFLRACYVYAHELVAHGSLTLKTKDGIVALPGA